MPGYLDTKQPRDVAAAPAVRVSGKPGAARLGRRAALALSDVSALHAAHQTWSG